MAEVIDVTPEQFDAIEAAWAICSWRDPRRAKELWATAFRGCVADVIGREPPDDFTLRKVPPPPVQSLAQPLTYGGCPSCGRANCVARECTRGVAPVEAPSLHQRALDSLKALMYRREQLTAADFARVVLTIQALQEHLFGKTDPVGVGASDSKTQAPKGPDHG